MYGLSQRELAKRAGGHQRADLADRAEPRESVRQLAEESTRRHPDVAPPEFFTLDLSTSPQVFFKGDELTDLGDRSVSLRLVAARRPNRAMSIMHEPLCARPPIPAPTCWRHQARRGGVVGTPAASSSPSARKSRLLGPATPYYFTSAIPHRFRNTGPEPCEIISASTPPTF